MKVYVLVGTDKDGNQTFNMPQTFGRMMRAYHSKGRAKAYARKFKCQAIELDTDNGKIVADEKDTIS